MSRADVPVVILCGGRTVSLGGQAPTTKPLVAVGGHPVVIHVLERYARAGFRVFILAIGRNYERYADVFQRQGATVSGGVATMTLGGATCRVTLADTGAEATTGERVHRLAAHVGAAADFGVHYSDVLSAADPGLVYDAHVANGRLATLLGARVPTRFRILGLRQGETRVRGFAERPVIMTDRINGGHYFFKREVLASLASPGCVIEAGVLDRLAAADQLECFPYDGPWHYLDADRHVPELEEFLGDPS